MRLTKIFASIFCVLLLASCNAVLESSSSIELSSSSEAETVPMVELVPARKIDRRAEYIYDTHPDYTKVDYSSPALLEITDNAGQGYIDSLDILCDSPMYWLRLYEMLDGGYHTTQIITGPEGTMTLANQSFYEVVDLTDNTELPIRDVIAKRQPENLMITVGINGISFMEKELFISEYTSLVTDLQELSPNSTIILQSILPITPIYQYYGVITNELITEANSWILDIAEDTGCYYLDTHSAIITDDGHAVDEWMMNDGLHLNREGLEVVLEYWATHALPTYEIPLPPIPELNSSSATE